jgi:hypothetical protein
MDDEFMAYGAGGSVSAFTLAMMEDLGFYMANYSAAQCMFWGRAQGETFVTSRCGTRRNDLGVRFQAASSTCDRSCESIGDCSGMSVLLRASI